MNARTWLSQNGYPDIVQLIDQATLNWKSLGKRTRRNWWETLAGGKDGIPRTVYGVTFPVLAVAQEHEGLPVTPNAERRNVNEVAPQKIYNGKSLTRLRAKLKRKRRDKAIRKLPLHKIAESSLTEIRSTLAEA